MSKKIKDAVGKVSKEAEERRKLFYTSKLDLSRNESAKASILGRRMYPG